MSLRFKDEDWKCGLQCWWVKLYSLSWNQNFKCPLNPQPWICLQCSSLSVPSRPILHVMHTPGQAACCQPQIMNHHWIFRHISLVYFKLMPGETQPYFKFQISYAIINSHFLSRQTFQFIFTSIKGEIINKDMHEKQR